MCWTWVVKYSYGESDHKDNIPKECDRGVDCPVRMGLKPREIVDIPDTCMVEAHKIVNPHLPLPSVSGGGRQLKQLDACGTVRLLAVRIFISTVSSLHVSGELALSAVTQRHVAAQHESSTEASHSRTMTRRHSFSETAATNSLLVGRRARHIR